MARIDSLIKHLYEFGADALGIGAGHQVVLLSGGERRPITAAPLAEEQVETLLREVVPPERAAEFSSAGEHVLIYGAPAGTVKLTVHRGPGMLRMIVAKSDEAPPPAPARPPADSFDMPKTGAVSVDELRAAADAATTMPMRAAPAPAEAPPPPNFGPEPTVPHSPASLEDKAMHHSAAPAPSGPPPASPAPAPAPAPVHPQAAAALEQAQAQVRPDIPAPVAGNCALDVHLRGLIEKKGSDLYICSKKPPIIRRDGDLVVLGDETPLTPRQAEDLLYSITPMDKRADFERLSDVDFAYEIPGLARFRSNLFKDRNGIGGIFRQIPSEILTAEQLNLPPAVIELCRGNKGLVVVTGPTGSGKSTTLAGMIDWINKNRSDHIITIEDPIEFVHEDKRCVFTQREIRTHTKGFKPALRAALREDPDIVLVGEMRDLETIEIAIETAETGHLVFGTLHTNTAPSTVDRIIDQFPTDRQSQVRTMLSESLRGVVAQTLCKKKGGGRIAALEILICTSSVSNIIREGKTFQIPSIMQTGKSVGMVTLNDSLLQLVKEDKIEPMEAYLKAVDKTELSNRFKRENIKLD